MRILFLSHYFPPEVNAPASRTFEHCRQWVKDGHDVTVITCFPNHPMGKIFPGYRNRLRQREEISGINVIRLWTFITPNAGFLKRSLNYLGYMFMSVFAAPFTGKADIVISTSPQFFNGLAGYFVSRMKRRPWVLEIRDLWPESILAVGAAKNRLLIRVLEALERFVYRKADAIVSVTDSFVGHIAVNGARFEKIYVIKNGVDLARFSPGTAVDIPAALGCRGKFIASYVGTHGMAHGLDVVLDAAELLRDEKDIMFLLVGDGADKARLLKMRDQMRLDNVLMLDQQPKDGMPAVWQVTDVSLVLLRDKPVFRTVIPSKIFESMAMKKPIIIGVDGESRRLVEEAAAGIFIEPENARQLADAVNRLHDDRAICAELGESGRTFVSEKFDRRDLARRYADLLETLTRK